MKRIILVTVCFFSMVCVPIAGAKDLEVVGKKLISSKPPFAMLLPSQFQMIYSSASENPQENSITRVYLYGKEKNKQAEEMFIVQIADKTNPQATPIVAPPLKAYAEKRMYRKDRVKVGELTIDNMVQSIIWNPEAPSLQPVLKIGIAVPSHLALQGQLLFIYLGEHAVLIKYSRDVHSFGWKVSEEKKDWENRLISGNEKKAYEVFQKAFFEMMNSIRVKNP